MSIDMMLEVVEQLNLGEIREIFCIAGVKIFEDSPEALSGNFKSNMFVFYQPRVIRRRAIAEEEGAWKDWEIGSVLVFTYAKHSFDECRSELKSFLELLAAHTQSKFVLSFQYEHVHAVRSDEGINFVEGCWG